MSILRIWKNIFVLLRSWEIYPLICLTLIYRLCSVGHIAFLNDEAGVFSLSRYFFTQGLIPITSNRASLGNLNPPFVVYLFMLPAAFSANPLWAEVLVAILNSLAVFLAYLFMRFYYGRMAAIITSFLYATSVTVLAYSGVIWPQNVLAPFTVLLWFMLFYGVVERKKGWFVPAVCILALMYQLHGSSLLLIVPFCLASIFAYKTIRKRDYIYALLALLVLFAPFIYWQFNSHFSDVRLLASVSKKSAVFDFSAVYLYRFFLSPYIQSTVMRVDALPTNANSLLLSTPLRYLQYPLTLEYYIAQVILVGGFVTSALTVVWPKVLRNSNIRRGARQGLLLLLVWQLCLPAVLLRHTIDLEPHYFLIFLPGQFMFIALFFKQISSALGAYQFRWKKLADYSMSVLVVMMVLAQLVGSTSAAVDTVRGNFDARALFPTFNNLASLQRVLQRADQLAKEYNIKRVYISSSYSTNYSLRYLTQLMYTPAATFDNWHCMQLPGVNAGSVIYISQPYQPAEDEIIRRFTHVIFKETSPRTADAPYKIYILTAKPQPTQATQTEPNFANGLKLEDRQASTIRDVKTQQSWLATHWQVMKSEKFVPRSQYVYHFDLRWDDVVYTKGEPVQCSTTAMWQGDQLFTLQELGSKAKSPDFITVRVQSYTTEAERIVVGALTLTTFNDVKKNYQKLRTEDNVSVLRLLGPQKESIE